ncbi:MAG: helix-turn-helix transcriptional regulator [Emticicia sp.]|nr:helix-turn-helix transcriptional regulator [Emticicia sp.]
MKNQTLIEKLNEIAQVDNTWQADVAYYEKNKEWLDRSAKIAVRVLRTLRQNRNTGVSPGSQKELADLMGSLPQRINKIVKGSENLTLETIAQLEKALNIQLMELKQTYEAKTTVTFGSTTSYIPTNDGGYIINTPQRVTETSQISQTKAGNSTYAMAA